jgi:hypothetical protein
MNRGSKNVVLGMTFILSAVLASACSTARVRMMPGANGEHRVVARDIERDDANEAAHKAALEYCENQGKHAVFISDKTKYDGRMDEDTRNIIRQGSKVAMMLGGQGRYGQPNPIGTAGRGGYMYTNERDYSAEMTFRCQ